MSFDIDIDVADRDKILSLFRHVPATLPNGRKHNTGVYFHKVPSHPVTSLCTMDHKKAAELGYFKIDILNVSVYARIDDEWHLNALLDAEPVWDLLQYKEICDNLFQMKGHHDVCKIMKPQSILELAAVLSMIRPAKKHLIGKPWSEVMKDVWVPSETDYYWKRSHAVAYAHVVKVHLNLILTNLSM